MTPADLPWLPRAPADLRTRLRALPDGAAAAGALAALASHALDEGQLRGAASALASLRERGCDLAPLVPFSLGVAASVSVGHLIAPLIGTALRYGIALRVVAAEFGQVQQSAQDPASTINAGEVDAVLLVLDPRSVGLTPALDDADAAAAVEHALDFVDAVCSGFRRHAAAPAIVSTLTVPPEGLFGSLERALPGTMLTLTETFNAQLASRVRARGDMLFDVAALAASVGTDAWHAAREWHLAKFPFAPAFVPLWAEHVVRVIAAARGKSRRVLVLDLDDTLWHGVVGDDGVAGIVVGHGDPTGEAHLAVQLYARALRDRGVILAVSSKNDDAVARAAFRDHPDMALREDDIAVFQANWDDKATNLRAIARALNLGLDALVLLDDNPVERALVRELVPQVAVPELPPDPAGYVRTLAAAGYFEAIAFTPDDRKRAAFYAGNAQRAALEERSGSLETYLASLEMTLDVRPFDAVGRARIVSLINKTNQFNVTTRRYTDPEVAALEADPDVFTLQARLIDRFGDNGMIGVVIARPAGAALEIDTWLMSCRVLGRGVEETLVREIVGFARERGFRHVVGVYRPTGRNAIVADLFARLGFRFAGDADDGERWQLDVDVELPATPMRVTRPPADTSTI